MAVCARLAMSCSLGLEVLLSLLQLELLLVMTPTSAEGRHCFYGERGYRPGEVFPIQKGCNTCTCLTNGLIGCTSKNCQDKVSCRYRGVTYLPGDTIDTAGSCSYCICSTNGYVACRTQRRCSPKQCKYKGHRYAHGQAIFDHQTCEVCRCFRGSMSCYDDVSERRARCRRLPTQCKSAVNGKMYAINEAFTAEDGCTLCICREGGYIACSKHRCRKDFCKVGNQTLSIGESTLVQMEDTFSGQSQCAMCTCDDLATLHCDRSHVKCRQRSPTEGVCVYKNRIYYEARLFLEVLNDEHCRQCLCNRNGIVSCSATVMVCPRDKAICKHSGDRYVAGDTFIETSFDYSKVMDLNDHPPTLPSASSTKQSLLQYLNEKLNQAYGGHVSGGMKKDVGGPMQVSKKASIGDTGPTASSPVAGLSAVRFGEEYRDCRLCTCGEQGQVDCRDSRCRVRTCTFRGKTFYSGQNFTTGDACKSCVCTDTGTLSCVSYNCNMKMVQRSPSPATASNMCHHEGIKYKYMQRFGMRQGRRCFNCICGKEGKVQCKDSQCKNSSDKSRSSCNYVVFGMFISTLKACKLVE